MQRQRWTVLGALLGGLFGVLLGGLLLGCGAGTEADQAALGEPAGDVGFVEPDDTGTRGRATSTDAGNTPNVAPISADAGPVTAPEYPALLGVPLAEDLDPLPGRVEVSLAAAPTDVALADGIATHMWTYNGQIPGPVIQARVGDTVVVHFTNNLNDPTTIHWHGVRVPNEMDGTPRTQNPIQPGESFTYEFVVKDAGTFWYHPHIMTHIAVERGLYGVLIVHEAQAPQYDAERVVFLDDILLNAAGQRERFSTGNMRFMHGRNGNALMVNGRLVQGDELLQLRRGSVERWRILNGANARTAYVDLTGADWRVIGWDAGLVTQPYVPKGGRLRVAAGERYDIEVRWSPKDQSEVGELRQWVLAQTENGVQPVPFTLSTLMSTGMPALAEREVKRPAVTLPTLTPAEQPTTTLTFEGANVAGKIEWQINGETFDKAEALSFPLDVPQTIELVNTQSQEHPFHIHGHFFRVVSRDGVAQPYIGLKDTVYVGPDETVRLAMTFDNPGGWMAHCHILEHAEAGMMRLFEVAP